jgi:four helix bundle protein
MSKIEKFEELKCWQESRRMVKDIVEICERNGLVRNYEIKNQVIGCAVSVMNNIAEGFCRFHKKEFIRFLDFSQASAGELKSMTYIMLDLNYINENESEDLQIRIESIRSKVNALIKYLNNRTH